MPSLFKNGCILKGLETRSSDEIDPEKANDHAGCFFFFNYILEKKVLGRESRGQMTVE